MQRRGQGAACALDPALAAMVQLAEDEEARTTTHYQVYTDHLQTWYAKHPQTIKQAVWNGHGMVMSVIPLSWQEGVEDAWDRMYHSGVLSPHWPLCPHRIDVTVADVTASFHTVDAAYQAQKYWSHADARAAFSKCMTPADVAKVKDAFAVHPRDPEFCREEAMLRSLVARYKYPNEAAPLLSTRGAFLLCCSPRTVATPGDFWSDGNGLGQNQYGLLLMAVRETLTRSTHPHGGTSSWPPMLASGRMTEMSGEDSVRRGSNQSADVVSTATSAAPEGDLAKLIGLLPALREAVQNGEVDDTLRAIDARQKFLRWSRLPEYIVLLRHGQSEGNVNQNIYTTKGDAQLELTPRGMEQAKNAGARLAKVIGDRNVFVAVSPFERAVQTLYGLFEGGFPRQQVDVIHHDPRLREQEFGNFQSIGLSAAVKAEMKAVGRFYYRRPNAESSADVFDRISAFWDALLSGGPTSLLQDRPKQFGACLLVTHGLTIRLLLMSIFQWSVETFESVFNIGNCEHITLRRNAHLFCYEFCASYSNPSRLPWATRNIWIRNRSADPNTPEVQVLRQRIAKLEEAREALPQDGWQRIDDVLDALHLELHKLCLQPYTVLDYLNIKAPQTAHKERALQMATAGHVCGQPDELLKKPRFLSSENESRIDFDSIEVDWWENVQSFKGRRLHMHNAERLCESLDTTPGGRAPLRRDTLRELRQDERCASSALRTRKPIIDTRRPRASASLQYSDPSRSDMRRTLDRQYGSMYTKEDMAAFGTESGDEEMLYFNRSCNWNGSDSPSTPNSPDSIYSPTDTVSLPTAARLVRPVPESPPRYPGTGGPSVADAAEEAIADAVGLLGEKVQSMSVEAAGAPGQPHP